MVDPDSSDRGPVKGRDEARQGTHVKGMRWVLHGGTALVIIAFVIIYLVYFG